MSEAEFHCTQLTAEGERATASERRTWWTVGLTLSMMLAELVVGAWSRSLALTADGWHMGTHAGALALSAAAWWYARTRARRDEFSFGTAKVHALAGYTNALALLAVALQMVIEAVHRLLHPSVIRYEEALVVAVIGLAVNLVSAWLLAPKGHTHDEHTHHGHHHHEHGAHNLRGAYLHVLADALTSVFAIAALVLGMRLGWSALDPLSALVGSALITKWAVGLLRDTAKPLLDRVPTSSAMADLRAAFEAAGATVLDLHVWEPVAGKWYCTATLNSSISLPHHEIRERLLAVGPIAHLTIELRGEPAAS